MGDGGPIVVVCTGGGEATVLSSRNVPGCGTCEEATIDAVERRGGGHMSRSPSPLDVRRKHASSLLTRSLGRPLSSRTPSLSPSPSRSRARLSSEPRSLDGTFHQHRAYDLSAVVGADVGSVCA